MRVKTSGFASFEKKKRKLGLSPLLVRILSQAEADVPNRGSGSQEHILKSNVEP
jgi:hypothetical protein